MIKLTQDRRALREGYGSVYINPAHVSAVVRNQSHFDTDNKSMIILENGEKITVQDYPEAVIAALEKGPQ
jgi:putative NADH-flavin reductase